MLFITLCQQTKRVESILLTEIYLKFAEYCGIHKCVGMIHTTIDNDCQCSIN